MNVSDLQYKNISRDLITALLFDNVDDVSMAADFCIVMGSYSATKYRVPKAINLYEKKLVKKFIFSGGKMLTDSGIYQEADLMKMYAVKAGIPSLNIYTAYNSTSTIDSLENAYRIIKSQENYPSLKIALITTTFHMKRCLLLTDKMFSKDITIIPYPVNDAFTTKDNWFQTPSGYERAIGEVFGIIDYANQGYIDNFKISI